jgi:TLD
MFMPESLQEHHYWLKYSLVRDGPGLLKMLRHCRASQHTVLAIESTDGHVFGSFTSHPWRLKSSKSGFCGSKESFVWRMRQSRSEPCHSVMEQILMESKIDVFPFTGRNNQVQTCTMDGVFLGCGEIATDENPDRSDGEEGKVGDTQSNDAVVTSETDASKTDPDGTVNATTSSSTHFGNAIHLDQFLGSGSTSSSETFGNPCLIHQNNRGQKFNVANIELWAMTPHETIQDADKAEMKTLFHQSNNLNLIEILVGGTSIA